MDTPAESSETAPKMPAAFEAFLADALPLDGGNHTLALGELHDTTEHLKWLKQHLPELRTTYGITTIGVERPPWFNVFLWAYQDGTLEKQLGSEQMARKYLRAVNVACIVHGNRENALAIADLLLDAMDAHIPVVAYDSRYLRKQQKIDWEEISKVSTDIFTDMITRRATYTNCTAYEFAHGERTNPKTLWDNANGLLNFPWLLSEMDWLCGLHQQDPSITDYAARLKPIEQLIETGHKKIHQGRLTSDGLSAVILDAMALPQGNRLTVGGAAHLNGMGSATSIVHPKYSHGTFGMHLVAAEQPASAKPPNRVTSAVIATTQVRENIENNAKRRFEKPKYQATKGASTLHLNLDTGEVEPSWQPPEDHPRVVQLEEKFPNPRVFTPSYSISRTKREAHAAAHINPLLMPDIKAAADDVRAAMNPDQEQGRPR